MKRKEWILSIVSITLIMALGIWYGVNYLNKTSQADGVFTFELIDKEMNTLIDEEIEFMKDDKLVDIMIENYEVKYEITSYGTWIQDINSIVGTSSYYLALYINNQYSTLGVDDIVLVDGMVVSWIATAF